MNDYYFYATMFCIISANYILFSYTKAPLRNQIFIFMCYMFSIVYFAIRSSDQTVDMCINVIQKHTKEVQNERSRTLQGYNKKSRINTRTSRNHI